jgi:predicted porin
LLATPSEERNRFARDLQWQPIQRHYRRQDLNGWQAGFADHSRLATSFSVRVGGFGNKITSFEIGITYEFSKNAELNLFYKSTEYKDLQFKGEPDKYDLKVDGPGIGLTFKF